MVTVSMWSGYCFQSHDSWIASNSCVVTTWAKGVDITSMSINNFYPQLLTIIADVTRVETDYLEETGTITVSWGGPERGHSCVTHYKVEVKEVT